MAEITACAESDIIVGHHLGGWFTINKVRFYSLATLFKNLLSSEPNIKRVLVPENIDLDVFVALKGLLQGDESDIPKTSIDPVLLQFQSLGIKTRKLYTSATLLYDDQPMILVKRLTYYWRTTILWPRDESVRAKRPKIKPFYNAFHSADAPVEEMELHIKDDLLVCFAHYKIFHYHGNFEKYIYCIGPNGSFRINRQTMKRLSAFKFKVFESFAGDMNFLFFPAQTSSQTFRKLGLLMINGICKVPIEHFTDFVTQLGVAGISVGVDKGDGDIEYASKFRILANPSEKNGKMVCKFNQNFKLDPRECKEEPLVEIIHLTEDDINNNKRKSQDSQPEGEGHSKKKKF